MSDRYRKKPVEIEAVQFTGDNWNEVASLTGRRFAEVDPEDRGDNPDIVAEVYDRLHSTWVGVKADQWIIRGVQGEFYPCDPDVFEATYEAVDDEIELGDTARARDAVRAEVERLERWKAEACPHCGHGIAWGVEYRGVYDGVLVWECEKGHRWPRFEPGTRLGDLGLRTIAEQAEEHI